MIFVALTTQLVVETIAPDAKLMMVNLLPIMVKIQPSLNWLTSFVKFSKVVNTFMTRVISYNKTLLYIEPLSDDRSDD